MVYLWPPGFPSELEMVVYRAFGFPMSPGRHSNLEVPLVVRHLVNLPSQLADLVPPLLWRVVPRGLEQMV